MKHPVPVYLTMFLILSFYTYAASVSRTLPEPITPGTTIDVVLKITQGTPGELFTLEETIPPTVEIMDFRVDGATEEKKDISTRREGNSFGWSFTPKGEEATITYTAKVSPQASGQLNFEAVFFDPKGFNQHASTATVENQPPITPPTKESNPALQTPVDPYQSTPSTSKKAEKKPTQTQMKQSSLATGILIITIIVIGGLAVFYYFTKPKKQQDTFNDTFFKKHK